MANKISLVTNGDMWFLELDDYPNTGIGFNAPIGSEASINVSGVGSTWVKFGIGDTDWRNLTDTLTGASISIVTNYLASTFKTIYANATSGNLTITLPPAITSLDVSYTIMKTDNTVNQVIVDANASELIEGSLTMILDSLSGATFNCDGTSWFLS